jgi:hypothetical protein
VPPHRGKKIRTARARLDVSVNGVGITVKQRPIKVGDQQS